MLLFPIIFIPWAIGWILYYIGDQQAITEMVSARKLNRGINEDLREEDSIRESQEDFAQETLMPA